MLLSIMLLSHGAMGQGNAMNTSIQSDPHFIGWYMGPSTSECAPTIYAEFRTGLSLFISSPGINRPRDLDDLWELCARLL